MEYMCRTSGGHVDLFTSDRLEPNWAKRIIDIERESDRSESKSATIGMIFSL